MIVSAHQTIYNDLDISDHVIFETGGQFIPVAGATVRLNGGYSARPRHHVFDISNGGKCFATVESQATQYHWGAKDDGKFNYITGVITGTDCTKAIQALIDNAVYFGGSIQASMVSGCHRTTGPIHVGYGDRARSIAFCGPKFSSRFGWENNFAGVYLLCDHWGNGIELQGMLHGTIANISLQGPYYHHVRTQKLGHSAQELADSTSGDNWTPPIAPLQTRYSINSGIHADPRCGIKPTQAYEDVEYPSYANVPNQYGRNQSTETTIENCRIEGFAVGIANQGCDYDGNGDFQKVFQTAIARCKWAMAWGNSQARLNQFVDSTISRTWTGFTTGLIGRQSGKPHFNAVSSAVETIFLMDVANGNSGNGFTFDNCYGETMYSLGVHSGSGVSGGFLKLDKCEFGFQHENRPIPKSIIELGNSGFLVSGSTFSGMACPLVINGDPEGCEIGAYIALSGLNRKSWLSDGTGETTPAKQKTSNGIAGVMFAGKQQGTWYGQGRREIIENGKITKAEFYGPIQAHLESVQKGGGFAAIEHDGTQMTITLSGPPKTDAELRLMGIDEGSICYHWKTNTLFVVTIAIGNILELEQITNYNSVTGEHYETVTVSNPPFSFTLID